MVNAQHLSFNASDRSYFAILKKEIHAIAVEAGFSTKKVGEVDIIVAEMVSNVVKHAGGGQLLVKPITEHSINGIEIICIDNGPGMTDVSRMMMDGVSTTNTLGNGLGSIKRLSNKFQIYTLKNWGTIILSRVFKTASHSTAALAKACVHTIIVPKPGEVKCGDGFYYKITKDYLKILLGDGLGHGPEAAIAVNEAINAFKLCPDESPVEIIRYINAAVKRTRGLVATVAVFNFKESRWKICGVGNIATRINGSNNTKTYLAYNGIVGLNIPNSMKDQEVEHENGQHIIMCSDGIKSRWDTQKYPSIFRYDPSILSAAIFKDFARSTDDMSVLIGKINL